MTRDTAGRRSTLRRSALVVLALISLPLLAASGPWSWSSNHGGTWPCEGIAGKGWILVVVRPSLQPVETRPPPGRSTPHKSPSGPIRVVYCPHCPSCQETWAMRAWIDHGRRDYMVSYEKFCGQPRIAISFSTWPPLLISIVLSGLLWRRGRPPGENACRNCRYNLTGNVSGTCPECGQPLPT